MTANTSATGGYLVPSSPAPAGEDGLDDLIHDLVVGTTGLDPTLVRPRWQPVPIAPPSIDVDWCAFGVQNIDVTGQPAFIHNPSGDAGTGIDTVQRQETIEYIFSFYGPNGQSNACLFRDMVTVPQNLEALEAASVSYFDVTDVITAPELRNLQWLRKFDVRVQFSRQVNRTIPIRNILSAEGTIVLDSGVSQPFNTGS